ncbi:MAG: DUF202 domain-containing protein [Clostridium sp.]|nr:DUF202 domain-containing protein [Clostridium sp.]
MNKNKNPGKNTQTSFGMEIESGVPREIPDSMKKKRALAYNQNQLALERTEFAKIRTDLAFTNSKLAAERTHLAYLRTVVSLIGSGATVYKALPLLGISRDFTSLLTAFLLIAAVFFIYKDITTYPKMKRQLEEMEQKASELAIKTENHIYHLDDEM